MNRADIERVKKLVPHDHPARIAWNILVLLGTLVFVFTTTYRIVFNEFRTDRLYMALYALFCVDIFTNFITARKIGHLRYEALREVSRAYLSNYLFADLLAALPLELIGVRLFVSMPEAPGRAGLYLLLQGLCLLKLLKARRIFRELEEALRLIPAAKRLVMVAYWLSISLHLMALGWIIIGGGEYGGRNADRYLRAVYWVTTTIATIGYGDYVPDHGKNIQIIYTIAVELLGVGLFSYIIANVSSLISNLDVARASYQRRLDEINAYLRSQRIPAELQDRVRDYYSYLWIEQKGVSTSTILEGMPKNLALEILMFLNREVLDRVELFRGVDELFIREIVQLLKPRIFLPKEYIIRQGEYGDCMYFLTSGEVWVEVDGEEIARLGPGSPFGETALIENLHRNASVVSSSYSTGYQLNKDDFDVLRSKYPEFDRRVRRVVEQRASGKRRNRDSE